MAGNSAYYRSNIAASEPAFDQSGCTSWGKFSARPDRYQGSGARHLRRTGLLYTARFRYEAERHTACGCAGEAPPADGSEPPVDLRCRVIRLFRSSGEPRGSHLFLRAATAATGVGGGGERGRIGPGADQAGAAATPAGHRRVPGQAGKLSLVEHPLAGVAMMDERAAVGASQALKLKRIRCHVSSLPHCIDPFWHCSRPYARNRSI